MKTAAFVAGVATVDITPPLGVELCGYGPGLSRKAEGVRDPLFARALYLQHGATELAIIQCDLISSNWDTRNTLARLCREKLGIPDANVVVTATHTHSGPATIYFVDWGQIMHKGYLSKLPTKLFLAVAAAKAAARPAKIGFAAVPVHNVGYNRVEPGRGPLDPTARLGRVDDAATGKPMALLVNFSAHAVLMWPHTRRVSADWPGAMARRLEKSFGGAVPMFFQGCCGNINGSGKWPPANDRAGDALVEEVGAALARQVTPALRKIKTCVPTVFAIRTARLTLPQELPDRRLLELELATARAKLKETLYRHALERRTGEDAIDWRPKSGWRTGTRHWEEERWARFEVHWRKYRLNLLKKGVPPRLNTKLQVLRVGDAGFVFWPFEPFMQLGLDVMRRSPFYPTFVVGYANHTHSYITTREPYEMARGGHRGIGWYEAIMAPWIYGQYQYHPSAGQRLVSASLKLLRTLRRTGRNSR